MAGSSAHPALRPTEKTLIPFNRPCILGQELSYMAQAVQRMHCSSNGPFTRQCQSLLEEALSVPMALLTTSCTHALELSALLLNIQPGDEVIVPSFTFVSTVNAFVLRGAKPVFADIRPDTLNLDERKLLPLLTSRTKAIVPVHYAGVGCEMDALRNISVERKIPIVEDNAHGLWGRYKGKHLGTFGSLATLSFHETKNISCGEGGALLINDPILMERAEIICDKGTNRGRFNRGQVDKYTWVDVGSSYGLSDLLAAYLYAQLEKSAEIQASRQRIWNYYFKRLTRLAADHGIRLPFVPADRGQSYHMFYILLNSTEQRQRLIQSLTNRGIQAVFHYPPLHLSAMGRSFGGEPGLCPEAEFVSARLLRLPFFTHLTPEQQDQVVEAIKEFLEHSSRS